MSNSCSSHHSLTIPVALERLLLTFFSVCCRGCAQGRMRRVSACRAVECRLCPPLTYGDVSALSLPTCSGSCNATAGFYCGSGALSSTGIPCPAGRFSFGGAITDCINCPLGRFGNVSGLQSPLCSGSCQPGQFSDRQASATCSACAAGRFGNVTAMTSPSCSGACPPGQYSYANFSSCVNCTAGYFCPNSSATSPTMRTCTAGQFRLGFVCLFGTVIPAHRG